MVFYTAADSVNSFVLGNITGAVLCIICILLLSQYLIKKTQFFFSFWFCHCVVYFIYPSSHVIYAVLAGKS